MEKKYGILRKVVCPFQVYGDVTAHVFQHEYDHLDGITFRQRATRFHWDQAKNKKKKLDRLRKRNERANQTFI